MQDLELIRNLSKIIGMQPSHLSFLIITILIALVAIIIAFILDSKEISGFNFDSIRFKKYLQGTKSISKTSKDLNIIKIQSFIKGIPSITSTNAQIIQLHIWGYITIIKNDKKVEIHKTQKLPDDLPNELYFFYESLFQDKDIITNKRKLIDREKKARNTEFAINVQNIIKQLMQEFKDEGYYKNNYKTIILLIKISALFLLFILTTLLQIESLYNTPSFYLLIAFGLFAFIILILGKKSFLFLILTPRGKDYLKQIQGLYVYIRTAEVERINFHNNPKEYNDTFLDLLPYALLFGMSDKWLRYMPLQTTDWSGDIIDEDFTSWW
jgi:hypothetical protein